MFAPIQNEIAPPAEPKISLHPSEVNFGHLPVGQTYKMSAILKNYGTVPGRFVVKYYNHASKKDLKVLFKKGPIAPGIKVKLDFIVDAFEPKHLDIKITIKAEGCSQEIILPVIADIVNHDEFEKGKFTLSKKVQIVPSKNHS